MLRSHASFVVSKLTPVLALSVLAVTTACGDAGDEVVDVSNSGQAFTFGTYTFGTLASPGKCLDVSGAGHADGTNIQSFTCNGTGAQSFRAESIGSGQFRLVNTTSNKCLDVAAAGTADGTNIHLWACNGSGAQSFWIEDTSGGNVRIVNTRSGKCVDVAGAGTADGTNVHLWSCNGTSAQAWQPRTASSPPPQPPVSGGEARIMTFNVRTQSADGSDAQIGNAWWQRRPLAQAVLRDNDPDVVALQEATDGQVADLRAGFEVLSRPGVVLLYDATRVDALEGGHFHVGDYGSSDPWGARYCNWEKFRLRSSGREFFVFGAHLSTAADNVPQLRLVLSRATEKANAGYATAVVGDFNFDATSMLLQSGFTDAIADKGGTFHGFGGGRGARLDFIGTKHFATVTSGVDTRRDASRSPTVYPSDHYPVWAALR